MIFGHKTFIDEYIVEILDAGPATGPALLAALAKTHVPPPTKQAVYKALRKLMGEEVVGKQGAQYVLSRYWLQRIRQFLHRHLTEPERADVNNLLDFEDGDSVTYTFKSPSLLDSAWAHMYDIAYEANPTEHVMLNYHPHEWLILSRPETERLWLGRFAQDKKMMLFGIGGSTFLDRRFQREFGSEYVKINLNETYGLKSNQYLAVVGDYVFEITTDEKFEKRINELFIDVKSAEEINQKQIAALSKLAYRSKLKLSKSKRKADMWRTKFKQDFYIPKPYYLFPQV